MVYGITAQLPLLTPHRRCQRNANKDNIPVVFTKQAKQSLLIMILVSYADNNTGTDRLRLKLGKYLSIAISLHLLQLKVGTLN